MADLPDLSSRPRRHGWRVSEAMAVAVASLLLANSVRSVWQAEQGRASADSHLIAARAELSRLRAEARGARLPATDLEGVLAPLLLSVDAPPAQVAQDLAERLPPGVRLQSLVLRYEEQLSLDLDVVARDAAAWDRLLEQLQASPRFAGLRPGPERREGEVHASVSARYVPVAAP